MHRDAANQRNRCCEHCSDQTTIREKKYRLADFFDSNWEKYISDENVQVSLAQFKAVSSIRVCRTAALGVDYYLCKECGEITEIYHNCRNRFCPTCSWGIRSNGPPG